MDDIVVEIAKHLAPELKIIFNILTKRRYGLVKIYRLNNYKKLNNNRIDLFPDLRELEFRYVENNNILSSQFDLNKIAKMKLVSFKFIDCESYHKLGTDFTFLKGLKTLKKLEIRQGDTYDHIEFDDIFKSLNLEYLDIVDYHGDYFVSYKNKSLEHMNLKGYNYLDGGNPITDDPSIFKGLQYMDFGLDEGREFFETVSTFNIKSLRITISIYRCTAYIPQIKFIEEEIKLLQLLKNQKLHKLVIEMFEDMMDFSFMKGMKIYELHILQSGMHSGYLPPIETIISNGVRKLYINGCIKYTDSELALLGKDVIVKQYYESTCCSSN